MNKENRNTALPSFLRDFSTADLKTLYALGRVKTIDGGDTIVWPKEFQPVIFIVLKGALRVTRSDNGRAGESLTLAEGDCIGNTTSCALLDHFTQCAAERLSTVMMLDYTGMESLPAAIKAFIFEKLNKLSSYMIVSAWKDKGNAAQTNVKLSEYMKNYLQRRNETYSSSPLIQKIVQNVPRLPLHVNELLTRLQDERTSAPEIVSLAKQDPSLVSVVLKTVNSSYYNLANKVADFQHAVTLLGFNQIYQMVVANGMRSVMPHTGEFQDLHIHSVITSQIAFELSKMCRMEKPVVMSTIGLLHDIGKSVVFLLKRQNPGMTFLFNMLDHSKLGSILLKQWNIPDQLYLTIEYQDYVEFTPPSQAPPKYARRLAILYIAHLCYEYLIGKDKKTPEGIFLDDYLRLLNLQEVPLALIARNTILPALTASATIMPAHVREFLSGRILRLNDPAVFAARL